MKTEGVNVPSSADLSGVQRALKEQTEAYFPIMNLARLRATDVLGKAGYTPDRIAAETGRYIGPQEWADSMGATTPYWTEHFLEPGQRQNAAAQAQADIEFQRAVDAGGFYQSSRDFLPTPVAGVWDPQAQQAFAQFQPGGMEQGLANMLGQFSSVYQGLGAGGGLASVDAQRQAAMQNDPVLQQLQQYIQQMQGLTQNADPIMQAIQQNLQGAPVSGVLPQTQPGAQQAPGFVSNAPGGGGVDLMALLRQLGYAT